MNDDQFRRAGPSPREVLAAWRLADLESAVALQDRLNARVGHLSSASRAAVADFFATPRDRMMLARLKSVQTARMPSRAQSGTSDDTSGDRVLALALARELGSEDQASLTPEEAEEAAIPQNKTLAEALTRRALRGVGYHLISSAIRDGSLYLDGQKHAVQNAGASARGHTNMCFYLSVAAAELAADRAGRARALKQYLAPEANRIAGELGMEGGFELPTREADLPVVYAYVALLCRPLCIYYVRCRGHLADEALLYYPDAVSDTAAGRLSLYYDGSHYQACHPS